MVLLQYKLCPRKKEKRVIHQSRKMMATMVLMLIAASFFMGCTMNQAGANSINPSHQVINLSGKVMCQDCTKGYGDWAQGSQPIKGSKVSVTCRDNRQRVMYYDSDETDEQGEFNMVVNKYMNGKELEGKSCLVRLVSSPHPTCNIPTNFNGGKDGVKLPRPTVVYRDFIQYQLGTFFYTNSRCDHQPAPGNNHY